MSAMTCKVCGVEKNAILDFYKNDKTCKECRKEKVRKNREANAEYYREYDRKRFKDDPRVQLRHKRYQATEKGKDSIKKAKIKYAENNPIKRAAHILLGNRIRDGHIVKPIACECCGKVMKGLHGHHDDYAKPLEVRWLCPACHKQWHEENGEGLNAR